MGELDHRIKDLIIKHLKDELTVEQQLELQEWVNASDHHQEMFQELTDPDRLNEALKEHFVLGSAIRDKVDAQLKVFAISAETPVHPIRPVRRRRWIYASAAAVLLFLFIISYNWLASRFDTSSKARPAPASVAARDVAPGGNKATLTLGNGATIVLENAADGQLAEQGVVQVSKRQNALSYKVVGTHSDATPAVVYNTLTTPRAGQFQVVLPDGTKVWLNNASSLRYPTRFAGGSREVELTGEGYFEVAKNEVKPFVVKIPGAVVHVLGTSFNVMAYNDEPVVKTTLLTGKVSIAVNGKQSVLSPNEQAAVNSSGSLIVLKNIDTEGAIAWIQGRFHFEHQDVQSVMRQLSRWYNIEVVYQSISPDITITGSISRTKSLSNILQMLEISGVHSHIEGNKIIIQK